MIKFSGYENPLIVAGHGIRLAGAIDVFHELLDKLDVPVVTTFNGFDIIPSDHPNFAGRIGTIGTVEGNEALREADVILFLGTRNNIRQTSYNWGKFAKGAFKIFVDIDSNELSKQCQKLCVCSEGIDGLTILEDAKKFITDWLNEL